MTAIPNSERSAEAIDRFVIVADPIGLLPLMLEGPQNELRIAADIVG